MSVTKYCYKRDWERDGIATLYCILDVLEHVHVSGDLKSQEVSL